MKAALLERFGGEFRWVDDVEIIEPRINEIRVRIVSCGLSSEENAQRMNLRGMGLPFPIVLGHEGAGIVEAVGPGVTKFREGDKVVMSAPFCGQCPSCAKGHVWACERADELEIGGVDYYGTPGPLSRGGMPVYTYYNQGALAEYTTVHVNSCVRLPDDYDLRLAGPLGSGLRNGAGAVYSVLKPQLNEWVVITGAGIVGFGAMWTAAAMGARTLVVDRNSERLALAEKYGADRVLNSKGMNCEELGWKIAEITGGADCFVECTGQTICYKAGLQALTRDGRCAAAGLIQDLDFKYIATEWQDCKSIQLVRMGNVSGEEMIPILTRLYKRGKFPYDKLIRFYHFEEIEQAMEDLIRGRIVKPVLLWDTKADEEG